MKPQMSATTFQILLDCVERTWKLIDRGNAAGLSGKTGEGQVSFIFDKETGNFEVHIFSYMAPETSHHVIKSVQEYIEWNNDFEAHVKDAENEAVE